MAGLLRHHRRSWPRNTKTPELWLQQIAASSSAEPAPIKLAVAQPGDSDPQFAPDGKRILFLSSRDRRPAGLACGLRLGNRRTKQRKEAHGNCDHEADNAKWSPDGRSIVFTSAVYPDCPPITPTAGFCNRQTCNADRDKLSPTARSKRRSSPISSIATGTTTPATNARISFWFRWMTGASAT